MAQTKTIRALIRIVPKIRDTFYSFEYSEERELDPNDNIEKEREDLWDTCFNQVADQINQTRGAK